MTDKLKTVKVLATSKGVYIVDEEGKTKECPVKNAFDLDERQAVILEKRGKLEFVTNKQAKTNSSSNKSEQNKSI